MDWGRKWLVDFNVGKSQLVLFDRFNNTGVIDVKMDGSVLRKNHLLRCWGCLLLQIGLERLHYLSGLYPSTFADLRFYEGLSFMTIGHCSWGFIWDEVVSIFSYVRLA